jgi:hypothetical protein
MISMATVASSACNAFAGYGELLQTYCNTVLLRYIKPPGLSPASGTSMPAQAICCTESMSILFAENAH